MTASDWMRVLDYVGLGCATFIILVRLYMLLGERDNKTSKHKKNP